MFGVLFFHYNYRMPDSKKYNILIVEDDDSNYLYISVVFESENINFTRAKDGYQAIDLVKKGITPFDLILMDIKLPGIDGFETTTRIRKLNSKIPIIAQTAYYIHTDVCKLDEFGFESILLKPFQITDLLNHVYNSLKKANTITKTIGENV